MSTGESVQKCSVTPGQLQHSYPRWTSDFGLVLARGEFVFRVLGFSGSGPRLCSQFVAVAVLHIAVSPSSFRGWSGMLFEHPNKIP